MATANLCLHRGARIVARDELDAVEAPPPTETWFPLRHGQVLATVLETLQGSGFEVCSSQLSLTRDNARFFGTLDLSTEVAGGTTLAVGVRNSVDKTFPLGFCAGCRVFVCDNLAFRSELLVARKHTRNGDLRFQEAIALAVRSLGQFREAEAHRIEQMRTCQLSSRDADSLMLQSYERGIISLRTLPDVITAWRKPTIPEFEERNLWTLLNAFTCAVKNRATTNPQQFALQTIRLNALLSPPEPKPCPDLNATAGACCRGTLIVEAYELDVLREPLLLTADNGKWCESMTPDEVRAHLEQEFACLLIAGSKPCKFLGENCLCSIYPTRPNACVAMQAGDEQCQDARPESDWPGSCR